jgi:acyl-coenzyme A thioesterase PaaI-like protein
MPAATGILTVEFKTNLLAPARGERFAFRATVVKPRPHADGVRGPRLCNA